MKTIKILAIILISVVSLILIIAAFLPDQNTVSRSITISKPVAVVYEQIADFNNWKAWNPWTPMDSTSKNWVTGTPKQTGSAWNWEGDQNKVGSGSMRLDSLKENRYLRTSLVFKAPVQSTALCYWNLDEANSGTRATWTFVAKADYPIGRLVGALFMDKMLGGQFEDGLQRLKKVSESK